MLSSAQNLEMTSVATAELQLGFCNGYNLIKSLDKNIIVDSFRRSNNVVFGHGNSLPQI